MRFVVSDLCEAFDQFLISADYFSTYEQFLLAEVSQQGSTLHPGGRSLHV
jgi:hypothetical protein